MFPGSVTITLGYPFLRSVDVPPHFVSIAPQRPQPYNARSNVWLRRQQRYLRYRNPYRYLRTDPRRVVRELLSLI